MAEVYLLNLVGMVLLEEAEVIQTLDEVIPPEVRAEVTQILDEVIPPKVRGEVTQVEGLPPEARPVVLTQDLGETPLNRVEGLPPEARPVVLIQDLVEIQILEEGAHQVAAHLHPYQQLNDFLARDEEKE